MPTYIPLHAQESLTGGNSLHWKEVKEQAEEAELSVEKPERKEIRNDGKYFIYNNLNYKKSNYTSESWKKLQIHAI